MDGRHYSRHGAGSGALTPVKEEEMENRLLPHNAYRPRFWMYAAFTGVSCFGGYLAVDRHFKNLPSRCPQVAIAGVCAVPAYCSAGFIFIDRENARSSDEWLIENGISGEI